MKLRQVLRRAAEETHNHILKANANEVDAITRENSSLVVMGHCYESARTLSRLLCDKNIPHKVVHGGIAHDFVANTPSEAARDAMGDIDYDVAYRYINPDGSVSQDVWDIIPYPRSCSEIPDAAMHYWIEVDGTDTRYETDSTYHVDVASEARTHYGDVFVREGHPAEHYIRPSDAVQKPWEWSGNPWAWNTETCEYVR